MPSATVRARTRERCQCRGRAHGQPRERLPCPGNERSARRVGCTELTAHGEERRARVRSSASTRVAHAIPRFLPGALLGAPIRRWDCPAAAPCLQDRARHVLVAPSLLFSPFLRALPERLRSQEGARAPSWSCASPAATQGAPPPPPALASSVHSRAPLPPGCSRGRGRHSWAGSDSSAQLEGAQLRTRMEGGPSGSGERRLGGQREPPARTRTGQRCCHERKLLICWE